jgi:uncharacterized cupredoxin-like copper-binding protein
MTDPSNPGIGGGTNPPVPSGSRPPIPRWVKVFGVVALVLAVFAAIALLTGHGPGRHMGGHGGRASTQPAREGIGAPAAADQADRTVEVTMLDTPAFQPSTINVITGETVTFEVHNDGNTVHEFTLGDAAMQQEHAQAMAHMPSGMAHEFPNSITLQPGETEQLTWRFGGSGPLEFACHRPGHYQAGMRGTISVA